MEVEGRYEYRRFGRLGAGGSALLAIVVGVAFWFSPGLAPVLTAGNLVPLLIASGVLMVVVFLFVWLVGQHLYWAVDEQGLSWRGLSMRRRKVSWAEVRKLAIVSTGRSVTWGGSTLKLELGNGETCLVRPSKRHGGLEPNALELLEAYAEHHRIVRERGGGIAMTGEDQAAIERLRAIDDDKEKLVFLKQELERQRQDRLFSPDD